MRRINGTGTTYLKITQPNPSGQSYATVWVTVLFFPLFPISRHLVKEIRPNVYQVFAKGTPALDEVLFVYLFGWIVYPLIIFGLGTFLWHIWPGSVLLAGLWILFSLATFTVVKRYW